jgi:hypothetical protein
MPSEPSSDYARSFGTILWIICSLSGDFGILNNFNFVRSILSARSLCGIDVTDPHVTCDTHVGLLAWLLAWLGSHLGIFINTTLPRCRAAATTAILPLPPMTRCHTANAAKLPPSTHRNQAAAADKLPTPPSRCCTATTTATTNASALPQVPPSCCSHSAAKQLSPTPQPSCRHPRSRKAAAAAAAL